jgi:tRNA pseudouridine32 synthase/23S rRNA pseudouridine746 synthase
VSLAKPKKKQGTIKGDMKKSRRSAWILQNSQENPAITRFFSQYVDGFRLFLLKPETGKTHQIRVALKSLGAAIYGDPIYKTAVDQSQSEMQAYRCYLHAWQLIFSFRGEAYSFRCEPDQGSVFAKENIVAALSKWQQPELLHWSKSA